jgi:hypothetical protein
MKPDSKVVNPAYPVTSPDHILVQGVLASGAVASFAFRKPPSTAVDDVGFRWLITGTKGEIEVTVPEMNWQFADPRMKLRIKKVGEETAREVDYVADRRMSGRRARYTSRSTRRGRTMPLLKETRRGLLRLSRRWRRTSCCSGSWRVRGGEVAATSKDMRRWPISTTETQLTNRRSDNHNVRILQDK